MWDFTLHKFKTCGGPAAVRPSDPKETAEGESARPGTQDPPCDEGYLLIDVVLHFWRRVVATDPSAAQVSLSVPGSFSLLIEAQGGRDEA